MLEMMKIIYNWLGQVDIPDGITVMLWITLFWLPVTRIVFFWLPRKVREIKTNR